MASNKQEKAAYLTVSQMTKKLEEFAALRPDADVCFMTSGDTVNEGWAVLEVGMVIDSGSARVLLVNDDKVIE